MFCRRPCLSDPPAREHHTGFICGRFPSPLVSHRKEVTVYQQNAFRWSTPDFSSRLSPEVFSTSGYIRKTAGDWNQSLPSPRWAAKGYRPTPARLPVIPLGTRSQHVIFAKSLYPIVVIALRVGKATDRPHVDLPAIVRSQRCGRRKHHVQFKVEHMFDTM